MENTTLMSRMVLCDVKPQDGRLQHPNYYYIVPDLLHKKSVSCCLLFPKCIKIAEMREWQKWPYRISIINTKI